MPTDIAKSTLDFLRQYDSVVFQQGRAGLEADNNESSRLATERLRDESADIVGVTGTPDDGYALSAAQLNYDLLVKQGTMYVGGVRVFAPSHIKYSEQSDWIDHQGDPLWQELASPANNEFVYLLLREQEVGAVEDGALREVALGGPDTCARTKIVQRIVRTDTTRTKCADAMADLKTTLGNQGLTPDPRSLDASGNWSGGRLVPGGSMQVTFENSGGSTDPCEPQAQGGYTQPDNQMIRVKVTTVSGPNSQLIWAYDDASFVYRAEVQDNATLKLLTTPVDDFHRPRSGQALEVLRAAAQLYTGSSDGQPLVSANDFVAALDGAVTTLTKDYDPGTQLITLADQLTANYTDPTENPPFDNTKKAMVFVRMWNQLQQFTPGQPVTLASNGVSTGVQVNIQGASIHVNSYWMVAVRPATPTKVYPDRYTQASQPAEGPRIWICPLAVINWVPTEGGTKLNTQEDCRSTFANLVDLSKRCPPAADAWPTVTNIDWINDQVIALNRFNRGFGVTMSRPMAPETINEQTFQVCVDFISPPNLARFGPVSLTGLVRVGSFVRGIVTPDPTNQVFTFVPTPAMTPAELSQFLQWQRFFESIAGDPRTPGLRCRILLTGDTILDPQGNPVDGEAFGNQQQGSARKFTRLLLPSGNGSKGGDFKSWLFIGIAPTVQMSPSGSFAIGSGPDHLDFYFSNPMVTSSITAGLTITSSIAPVPIPLDITYPSDNHAVVRAQDPNTGAVLPRFPDPPAGQSAVTYTVKLDGQTVVDQDGLQLDGDNSGNAGTDFTAQIKIVSTTRVISMSPTGTVPPSAPVNLITITFSGPIDTTTVVAQSMTVIDANNVAIAGNVNALNSTTVTFTPNAPLPIPKAGAGAVPLAYNVTVFGTGPHAIKDASGAPIAGAGGTGPGSDFHGQFSVAPFTGVASFFPLRNIIGYADGEVTTIVIQLTASVTIAQSALQGAMSVSFTSSGAQISVAGTVSLVSPTEIHFDPTDGAFFGTGVGTLGKRRYTYTLFGHSCVDAYGAAIDGAGSGISGSDFSSFFYVRAATKDPILDKTKDKVGTNLRIVEKVKATQEFKVSEGTSVAARIRRATRKPPAPPSPAPGGGPAPAAAAGQPFIRADERPLVGGAAMLGPNP